MSDDKLLGKNIRIALYTKELQELDYAAMINEITSTGYFDLTKIRSLVCKALVISSHLRSEHTQKFGGAMNVLMDDDVNSNLCLVQIIDFIDGVEFFAKCEIDKPHNRQLYI